LMIGDKGSNARSITWVDTHSKLDFNIINPAHYFIHLTDFSFSFIKG
jgi:hypothetical protein